MIGAENPRRIRDSYGNQSSCYGNQCSMPSAAPVLSPKDPNVVLDSLAMAGAIV